MKKIILTFLILVLSFNLVFAEGNRWTSKPPMGSQIDWEHPLAKGLVGVWLMNENGGKTAKNLLDSNKFVLSNNAVWSNNKKGAGIKTQGTSNYAVLTNPTPKLKPAKDVTLIWYGSILGNMASSVNNPRLVNMHYDDIDSSPYSCYGIIRLSADNDAIRFVWNNGTSQGTSIQNYIPSSEYGNLVMFALTIGRAGANFYKNGIKNSTSNTNVGTISYSATSLLIIGSTYAQPTNNDSNSITNSILIYDRNLSQSEINQLYQNPYCFIKSPTIWSKFSTAVAAVRRMFIAQ